MQSLLPLPASPPLCSSVSPPLLNSHFAPGLTDPDPCQTDDVGVFGSPLSNEWRLIQKHFRLSRAEILGLARRGIDVIFGSADDKAWLKEIMW